MESRLYTFVNPLYMKEIQHGIQSLHVGGELHQKYHRICICAESDLLYDWNDNHKTVIVLAGGPHGELVAIRDYMFTDARMLGLPFAHFNEDEYSLGGILTCVGVVVPEPLYNAVNGRVAWASDYGISDHASISTSLFYRNAEGELTVYEEDSPEWRFITLLKSKPLAK